jgi:hypothetical protein
MAKVSDDRRPRSLANGRESNARARGEKKEALARLFFMPP